ncbi:hypothetical protein FNV43_RR05421 [Rhamnella rubrinervis]|uniref:Carbonic anhydrase n=1 Tax=Rhamnella rubrinervis TaxID=2594499 RepID=A0A8K0MR78_9ROSA|nr:hypothetical protein FNV43_RR05421 [Rhamnella rubrinervis]
MEKLHITKILVYSFFFVLALHLGPATSAEVEDEREFSYEKWSENGPARWGEIHQEWSMCSNGTMQSPIDLLNKRVEIVSHLGRLKRNYKPSNATLKNRGHDMMLQWEGDAGHIGINGTKYELKQCHWHSPSEHTINGKKYDLELHLVHETPQGHTTVVGILYKIGRSDSFLSSMEEHLDDISSSEGLERVVGVVDPKHIKMGSSKYYRYMGSLTTPPCTQNVVWTILKKVRTVTREQIRLLRVAVHDESDTNARPVQELNERWVKMFRPRTNN